MKIVKKEVQIPAQTGTITLYECESCHKTSSVSSQISTCEACGKEICVSCRKTIFVYPMFLIFVPLHGICCDTEDDCHIIYPDQYVHVCEECATKALKLKTLYEEEMKALVQDFEEKHRNLNEAYIQGTLESKKGITNGKR